MNKAFALLLSALLIGSPAFSDELIKDFEDDSVAVLNEELRIKQERIDVLTERVTTLEGVTPTVASGTSIQTVNVQVATSSTGSTAIPIDDSKPQNTEGDEYMTRAITPSSASNKLLITVVLHGSHSADNRITAALFQDSAADALAVGRTFTGTTEAGTVTFNYHMTAGTTSATTFKVRAGGGSGTGATFTFNGSGGSRIYGGALVSSITIEEIKA